MKALDTCVLARFVLRDDARQSRLADEALSQDVFVPATVWLELAWLLRSRYAMPRVVLAETMLDLLALPQIITEQREALRWAFERFRERGDLADLMHVAAALSRATAFVTFDGGVAQAVGASPLIPIETLS